MLKANKLLSVNKLSPVSSVETNRAPNELIDEKFEGGEGEKTESR